MKTQRDTSSMRALHKPLALALACALPICCEGATSASRHAIPTISWGSTFVDPHVVAQDFIVTNCNDSGPGSLREAFANADDGSAINLDTLPCSKITLTTGSLSDSFTASKVVIFGGGQTIDGNGTDRVFLHSGSGYLKLQNLTITNGLAATGGCIFSNGAVQLDYTSVNSCVAAGSGYTPGEGGGVFAQNGAVTMFGSIVTGNTARSQHGPVAGGGVWAHDVHMYESSVFSNNAVGNDKNFSKGGGIYASRVFGDQNFLVRLYQSSISGNRAEEGGGIFSSDVYSYKSTIDHNIADAYGGGVFMPGAYENSNLILSTISSNTTGYLGGAAFIGDQQSVSFDRCTITQNQATHPATINPFHAAQSLVFASGVHSLGHFLSISGTIISGNVNDDGNTGSVFDLTGDCPLGMCSIQVSVANSLLGGWLLPVPADTIRTTDPHLGPLAYNGGFTQTHALLPGSPAIDAGSTIMPAQGKTDQRCSPLSVGARQDIGAFELDTDTLFSNGFDAKPREVCYGPA